MLELLPWWRIFWKLGPLVRLEGEGPCVRESRVEIEASVDEESVGFRIVRSGLMQRPLNLIFWIRLSHLKFVIFHTKVTITDAWKATWSVRGGSRPSPSRELKLHVLPMKFWEGKQCLFWQWLVNLFCAFRVIIQPLRPEILVSSQLLENQIVLFRDIRLGVWNSRILSAAWLG